MTIPRDDISVSADDVSPLSEEPPSDCRRRADRSDLDWLNNVYQGDKMPQFTLRTIVMGMLIGGLMSISNLYVGLKMGWGFGVTITSCIIAFAVFKTLEDVIPAFRRQPFNILEDCTMTTCASAAGSLSTGALISAVPALYLTTGQPMIWWQMMIWVGCIAMLGVCMAIPLKRQLINIDQAPLSLRNRHGRQRSAPCTPPAATPSSRRKRSSAARLFAAAAEHVGGRLGANLRSGWAASSATWSWGNGWASTPFPRRFRFSPASSADKLMKHQTISFEGSTIFLAAGALMGIRVGCSLLDRGDRLFRHPAADAGTHRHHSYSIPIKLPFANISAGWTLWPAVAMMVASGPDRLRAAMEDHRPLVRAN